jgi:peptidoglycan hydrolase-like protein with peptidoglycan-binding domain
MGLETTAAGVRQYQRSHGLFVDGDWGDVTETFYQFVRDLQEYLNTWDAVRPPVKVDGDRGPKTKAAEKQAKRAATEQRRYRPPAEPPRIG